MCLGGWGRACPLYISDEGRWEDETITSHYASPCGIHSSILVLWFCDSTCMSRFAGFYHCGVGGGVCSGRVAYTADDGRKQWDSPFLQGRSRWMEGPSLQKWAWRPTGAAFCFQLASELPLLVWRTGLSFVGRGCGIQLLSHWAVMKWGNLFSETPHYLFYLWVEGSNETSQAHRLAIMMDLPTLLRISEQRRRGPSRDHEHSKHVESKGPGLIDDEMPRSRREDCCISRSLSAAIRLE